MLYHQILIRYSALEEENWMGKVWKWDLHLVHPVQVRRVLVDFYSWPDLCRLQVERLQHESRVFAVEGRLTLLRRSREMQEIHNRSTYVDTTSCGL